ncbi:post-GPI attachment to proteins factor 6 [Anabrus simplex]|uniref:post-GPI attachment to proteins factor 6 n=1 Tax=Anabrus simplex TaxID=316456 RepID=UPI0035A39705
MAFLTSTWMTGLFLLLAVILPTNSQEIRHSRSARREISKYRMYKDVSLLPYNVPKQTSVVSFNFTVREERIHVGVNKCPHRKVTVVLKSGSFPVVNPDGAAFPKFYWNHRVPQYSAEFLTSKENYIFNIKSPTPGDWYAAVFLSYTDPKDDKIVQQGLTSSCIALMESSMNFTREENVITLALNQSEKRTVEGNDESEILEHYKFYVPDLVWEVHINLTVDYCKPTCPSLNVVAEDFRLPDTKYVNHNSSMQIHCSSEEITKGDSCVLQFMPSEEAWYYVSVGSVPSKKSGDGSHVFSYTIKVTFDKDNDDLLFLSNNATEQSNTSELDCNHCWPRVPLMRQNYPAFFTYDFVRIPFWGVKPSSSVNITTSSPTVFKGKVHSVKDIGGTLTFEMRLDKDPRFENITDHFYNISVVSCMSYKSRSKPTFPDLCVSNSNNVSRASIVVNSTSSSSVSGKILVPYPEPGWWYVTLKPFCFIQNSSHSKGNYDTDYKEVNCSGLNFITVAFVFDSDSCGPDSCGRYGTCVHYMSGGVIYSTCVCDHGYRGWGCTDDSRVTPLYELLIAALLLTLSNMFFIPAIVIAIRRKLWTESFVYSCTMFFSTFYHACEAGEDVYSFCIMKLGVLQFCDFYTAILSLWVTLLCMADLTFTWKSLAHMVGAVGIALGTEYDRTSLAVFLVPAFIGLSILGYQWGSRCRRQKACYPKRHYWLFYFSVGLILVFIGLICYSFLQTRSNYKYIHSLWHALMAVSIVFLLPMKKYTEINTDESDYSDYSLVSSIRSFWANQKFRRCKLCRRQ